MHIIVSKGKKKIFTFLKVEGLFDATLLDGMEKHYCSFNITRRYGTLIMLFWSIFVVTLGKTPEKKRLYFEHCPKKPIFFPKI